jgi:hypothetical protein
MEEQNENKDFLEALKKGIPVGCPVESQHYIPTEEKKDSPILIVAGTGGIGAGKTALAHVEEAIIMAKEQGKKVAIVGAEHHPDISEIDFSKMNFEEMAKPYLYELNRLPIEHLEKLMKDSIPNKLQLLQSLKLSPEQKDYFLNAPPQRLEGENFEDYKTRRMLNKLLIKYRGQY